MLVCCDGRNVLKWDTKPVSPWQQNTKKHFVISDFNLHVFFFTQAGKRKDRISSKLIEKTQYFHWFLVNPGTWLFKVEKNHLGWYNEHQVHHWKHIEGLGNQYCLMNYPLTHLIFNPFIFGDLSIVGKAYLLPNFLKFLEKCLCQPFQSF